MNSSYLINFFHTCFRGLEEFNPRRKRHFRRHKTSSATAMEVLESRQLLSGTNADLTPVSSFDLIVDTNVDESDGDFSAGDLSLREAIEMANQISANNPEQVRIGFASALRGDTILLNGSQLEITGDVGLTGFGDADLTINANGQSRAFYISGEAIADLEGLTITGGLQQLTEAASGTDHLGGAIFNQGILRVTESVIFGNQAYEGGAIYSEGTTTVELSVLKENRAAGNGGAISGDDGLVVISESTLENNSSQNNGGAIFLWSADLQVESSLLTQNSATIGGAISARANHGNEFYLINSTLVENEASFSGGGVYSFTDTYITNSTISGNRVLKQTNGGGGGVVIRYYDNSSHGTLTLHNSIVAGNYQDDQGELSGSEIDIDDNTTVGNVVSGTHNIIGDAGTSESLTHGVNGNIVGNNGVGTLAIGSVLFDADSDGMITHRDLLDHTGPTKSLSLGRNSLAIDAGDNSQAKDASGVTLLNDQRGQQRVREGNLDQVETVDIGAYEMATPIIVNTLEDTVIVDEFTSLREAITAAHVIGGDNVIDFADSLSGGTITLNNSEIGIGSDIFIRGLGRDNLTIDANDMSQHFVNNGASISTIADVRLTGGNDVQTDFGLGGSIENDGILNIAGVKFDNNYSRYRGGAIYNHDGSDLTILNSNFIENTSNYQGGSIANHGVTTIYSSLFEGNTAPYQGGAIYNYHYFPVRDFDGQVAILDSQFISNQAIDRQGGALYSAGGVVSIDGSDFIDNFAPQDSGAISTYYTQLSIRNSLFEGNETTAFHAGAVLAASTDNILISHSTFRDNHAAGFGGGVYITNGFDHLIEYSTFEGNSAGTGGGLMLLGSGIVRNSTFTNNTSRQDGGGIVFSHPNSGNARQFLINSTVSGNTAGWSGGGVFLSRGNYLTLTNSTVTQNHAEGSGGGGVNVHTGTVEINNSIVAGNTLGSERVMKDLGNNGHLDFINYIGQHSLFGDTDSANYFTDGVDGNRIGIDVDTVLDSELKDNGGLIKTHALLEDSLAINAGNNALALDASMNALTTDQRGSGFDRIIGDRVDIGAYESTSMTGGGPTTRIDISPSSLGYGIPGQDNATGAGFILYSQQSVQQRFAGAIIANGAEHFVAVRYLNSQWQYAHNDVWVDFTPTTGDRLIASVNFDSSQVQMLQGSSGSVNGINQGYVESDLTITPNQWRDRPNAGEFGITGTYFTLEQTTPQTTRVDITPSSLGYGIPGQDNATGAGFILYSQQSVQQRFAGAVVANGAEHFVVVRFISNQWQYANNDVWVDFTPTTGDRLIAAIDFSSSQVQVLQGSSGSVNGINQGYVEGDLTITPNQWRDRPNAGEFGITGTYFSVEQSPPQITQVDIAPSSLGYGIPGQDNATGNGFIMYSQQSVQQRFAGAIVANGAEHFLAVRFINNQWQYANNDVWVDFTPTTGDRLIAAIDFGSSQVQMLQGSSGSVNGINQGYVEGDLTITANQWRDVFNEGEFGITGTYFSVEQTTPQTTQVDISPSSLGYGIPGQDNATGNGFIMYSQQSVQQRFAGAIVANGAEHFLAVRFINNQWQYANNDVWVDFTPTTGDRLIAAIDFDSSQVEMLRGSSGSVNGINQGYLESDLMITANQWRDVFNEGEFSITGTYFTFE